MSRPLVLLSNDDGFQARGLRVLREALMAVADVITCAPESEQSASSHSLTLWRPLRLKDHGDAILSIDGTPADCVYVALHSGTRVLPRPPDVVVSGMNHGLNLGTDVFYSGTVAAAREGALRGIPALAVSGTPLTNHEAAAAMAARMTIALLASAERNPVLLNVNFPAGSGWPVRATRLGARAGGDNVEFRHDPRGMEYLWLGGPGTSQRAVEGSDTAAHDAGAVGVTSLVLDLFCKTSATVAETVVRRVVDAP